MTAAQSGMMTKLLGLLLSVGTPQPKRKMVGRCERAGLVLHVFNGGFRDRHECRDDEDAFIKARVHHFVQVPVLRVVHPPVVVPKQGKREARRRKRQMARIAARNVYQMAA